MNDEVVVSSDGNYRLRKIKEEAPRLDEAKLRQVDVEVLDSGMKNTLMTISGERNNGVCLVSNTNS